MICCFYVMENMSIKELLQYGKSYTKIIMDFVEKLMENKMFVYMRISTNHKAQKIDRQQQTIIEFVSEKI